MCGIAGVLGRPGSRIFKKDLSASIQTLHHRGPDDKGLFAERNVGLAHARLSIIDLSAAGHQPMMSPCGRYVLVYNGELYNAPEIRAGLRTHDIEFRGHSDTEVLLHALIQKGADILPALNGMFAFAFWDREEKTLLCARDRFGIKPFYYAIPREKGEPSRFVFGSEIKALFAANQGVSRTRNMPALPEFLFYGVSLGGANALRRRFQITSGAFAPHWARPGTHP